MRNIVLAALALLLVARPEPSQAVEVALYTAETLVTGMAEPERTRGMRQGIRDVVVKMTGDPRLGASPRIDGLLANPAELVDRFEYEDRMKDIPVHDEQGTRDRPYFLRMRLKPGRIDAALAALGLRVWSADRPLVAVRIEIATAAGRYVLADSGADGYGQRLALTETARRLGLPIRLPAAGAPTAGWTQGTGATLTGRLALTQRGAWDATWRFDGAKARQNWRQRGVSFDTAFRDGLGRVVMTLSGAAARR